MNVIEECTPNYPLPRNLMHSYWFYLPDSILLKIFSHLNITDIPSISLVCRKWYAVSQEESLWKLFFHQDFKISKSKQRFPAKESWLAEYRRLVEEIPIVQCECLEEHNHQVLHVSFSHNGKMFATTSKDAFVVVWSSTHPAEVLHHKDMKYYSWQCTLFSQFNSTDNLLLVSGALFGYSSKAISGEIAVLNLEDDFELQCRVLNKPYDLFGTWYNHDYLLSGELKWLGHNISTPIIWLNKVTQQLESNQYAIVSRLYQFYSITASVIRSILVADCLESDQTSSSLPLTQESHAEAISDSSENESSSEILEKRDKYLLFMMGSKANLPHQIGLKRIHSFNVPMIMADELTLKERIALHNLELEQRRQGIYNSPDWQNYEAVKDKFDNIDHVFDLHSHIIGMNLSPDHRYLYVNSRPWVLDYSVDDSSPPVISQQVEIHVIDLATLKEVGAPLRLPQVYSLSNECFFIFLDVSHDYVASGAEDCSGYLWERNYQLCLARIPHKDVVNSVAFNPTDPEMLISVSDDHTIKVWRSRRRAQQLGIIPDEHNLAKELRIKRFPTKNMK